MLPIDFIVEVSKVKPTIDQIKYYIVNYFNIDHSFKVVVVDWGYSDNKGMLWVEYNITNLRPYNLYDHNNHESEFFINEVLKVK